MNWTAITRNCLALGLFCVMWTIVFYAMVNYSAGATFWFWVIAILVSSVMILGFTEEAN